MTPQASPHAPLTPQMRSVLDRMARAGHPPLYTLTPDQAKAAYEAGAGVLEIPTPALARVEDLRIPARDGQALSARLYAPSREVLPALLYFHGGGFTIGSIASHDVLCRALSQQAGCAVVSLGYRLAPQHKFPTAAHDAWDALAWLAAHAGTLGLDAGRLAVGGDSAGGTLAAASAFHARERGLPLQLQLLITPGTAARASHPSHRRFAEGYLLDAKGIEWFFGHYIDDAQRDDWRFAPLQAEDHAGLAPAAVLLAEADPLVDEGLEYADVLRAAGVPVQLELTRGVTHDFIKMGRSLPEAITALDFCAQALKDHLHP